nr:uncharacterized protein LOC123772993 [Procambarus clarkii]
MKNPLWQQKALAPLRRYGYQDSGFQCFVMVAILALILPTAVRASSTPVTPPVHDDPARLSPSTVVDKYPSPDFQDGAKVDDYPSHILQDETQVTQEEEEYRPSSLKDYPRDSDASEGYENIFVRPPVGPQDAVRRPRQKETVFEGVRKTVLHQVERQGSALGRDASAMNLQSLEVALLSLAILTFAVFIIDLVQDLLRGTTSGRSHRGSQDDADDGLADLIVLTLSSLDTVSYGREHPDCGKKLLCHLNRSGWHTGILGTASNYFVSLLLTVYSPTSGFQKNLDAANYGRESEECTDRYSTCPSVLGDLLPSAP